MPHECTEKETLKIIFSKLDAVTTALAENAKEQALTNQMLKGNGTPGIAQRVTALEENQKKINVFVVSISAIGAFLWGLAQFLAPFISR